MNFNGFEITPQSGDAGANDISISVAAVNEGLDKIVEVDAISGDKSARLTLIHEGKREKFVCADGDFILADGGTFNVLKPYTKVPYIESSGTQYLNLGVVFKNTDECYAEVAMLTDVTDKFFLVPSSWNNNKNRFALGGCYSRVFGVGYGNMTTGTTRFTPSVAIDENKHIFTYRDFVFRMVDVGSSRDVSSIVWGGDTTELRLFYGYNAPTACRVYRYWQKRDGELIIDLIPVVDDDNIPCMYDNVSKRFLYNAGSGSFIAGK